MAKKIDYSKILRGGDNKPSNPELWEKAKAAAKAKFDVYPSAVANAWASRYYADKGGSWKKMAEGGEVTITPEDLVLVKRQRREQPFFTSLEQTMPPRKGVAAKQESKKGEQKQKPQGEEEKTEPAAEQEKTTMEGVDATPEELLAGGPIEKAAEVVEFAEGGNVGSLAALTTAVEQQKESPFPVMSMFPNAENPPSAKTKQPQALAKGGYVVTRSNERKGKTHKVTGPDGSVKFFGDPNLKNRPNNPEAKSSWYARHAKSLKENPHFRAYARATWAEGGIVPDEVQYFQEGGISGAGSDVPFELLSEEEQKRRLEAPPLPPVEPEPPLPPIEPALQPPLAPPAPAFLPVVEPQPRERMGQLPPPVLFDDAAAARRAAQAFEAAREEDKRLGRAAPVEGIDTGVLGRRGVEEVRLQGGTPPAIPTREEFLARKAAERAAAKPAPTLEAEIKEAVKAEKKSAPQEKQALEPDDLEEGLPSEEMDRARIDPILKRVEALRNAPQKDYEDALADLQSEAKNLTSDERAEYANALSKVQTHRKTLIEEMTRSAERVKEETEGPFRKARGPLAFLRAGIAEADKYGDRYGEFLQQRKKALEQLGGEIPFTGNESEAQRQNILERNRFRREAAGKVADEMLTAFAPRAAITIPAQPEQKGAPEPAGAVIPATPELAAEPVEGAKVTPIETSLQAQIDAREEAMKGLAAAAKGQAVTQGTATGITKALADIKKADGSPLDLSNPVDRYSPQVKAVVSQMGDYALVKGAMTAVGYDDKIKDANGTTAAERIAIDEVLRGSGRAGLGTMPTGLEAMEIARQSPEYQQAAQAAATRAQIALEDAKLKAKEIAITNQIRTAQVDLDLKLAQDYQLKKRVLEQQTTELRRQINNATLQPKSLFVRGENFAISSVIAALDLIGSGLGAKGSVMDFVQQRIRDDLNLQVGMIDQKRTMLGDLVKQGNDIDSAYKLADAFYKKVYALEIEKATSSLQSDRARLAGFDAAQKLLQDAAKTEEDILKKTTDTIRDFYQNKLTSAATGVRNAAEYARIKAPVKAAGIRAGAAEKKAKEKETIEAWKREGPPEIAALWEGKTIDDKGYALLAKWAMASNNEAALRSVARPFELTTETRTLPDKSVISLPSFKQTTGRHILAYSEKDKGEYTSVMGDAKKFLDSLNELEEIAAKHNYTGFSEWTGKDAKSDAARAKKVEGDLANALGGKFAYNVGVPQEAEYKRLKDAIPKASEFTTDAYSKGAFGQFRNDLLRQVQNIAADRLVGGTMGGAAKMPPPKTK